MELVFCDLCQQSVPLPDLDAGRARRRAERVVCEACLALLAPQAMGREAAAAPPALQALERGRRRASQLLTTALSAAALIFAVTAAGLLLLRLERQDEEQRRERERLAQAIAQLRERSHGLERLAARLVQEEIAGLATDVRLAAQVPDERLREVALGELEAARRELLADLEGVLSEAERSAPAAASSPAGPDLEELHGRLAWVEDQLSDLRLRRDLPPEREPLDTGLPPPQVGGSHADRAALAAALASESPAVRAGALFALAAAGDRAAVRDVLPLLSDPHPYVRETAARLLERLDARPAVQALIGALGDEDVHVREAAVTALRGITRRSFGFDPRADTVERAAAVAAWEAWWRGAWKSFLYGEEARPGD